jgi:hypothetical protein
VEFKRGKWFEVNDLASVDIAEGRISQAELNALVKVLTMLNFEWTSLALIWDIPLTTLGVST